MENPALRIRWPHQLTYPSVARPKHRLNQRKNAPGFLPWSKQERGQRRAQAKRIESGDHDRHRDGHRELLIEPAGDARNKRRRHEHGGENQRDRDYRPGDLFHGLKGRIPRRQSLLDVVLDGFDHDDRIVHYEADRQHKPE
jgi:hypothetical protein